MSYQNQLQKPLKDSEVEGYFNQEHLLMPYLPPQLQNRVKFIQPGLFGTRVNTPSPYDLPAFIDELLSNKKVPDYLMVGIAGHGVSSRFIHYYVVTKHLALFYQLLYGNADWDEKAIRNRTDGIFRSIYHLFQALKKADPEKLAQKGDKLVVIESDIHGHAFGWLKETETTVDPSTWHTHPTLIFPEALNELELYS